MSISEPGSSPESAVFFESRDAFIAWLDEHHADVPAYWVGLYKKGSGRVNMTWPESVDAALCFGWIDGQGKSLGEEARAIRFSPRRKGRIWSAVTVRRVGALAEQGLVFCGTSPEGDLVEMIELPNHPHFVGCQFHPEFKSKPFKPHPLFAGFVKASMAWRDARAREGGAEVTKLPVGKGA